MNLEINEKGIEGTSGAEQNPFYSVALVVIILYFLIMMLIDAYQLFNSFSGMNTDFPKFMGFFVSSMFRLLLIGLFVYAGFGRRITVDFERSSVVDKYSFVRFAYNYNESVLEKIGREAGEKVTDYHKIYVRNQLGERLILLEANRYRVDEKWNEIKEHTPDHFLKEYEKQKEDESAE